MVTVPCSSLYFQQFIDERVWDQILELDLDLLEQLIKEEFLREAENKEERQNVVLNHDRSRVEQDFTRVKQKVHAFLKCGGKTGIDPEIVINFESEYPAYLWSLKKILIPYEMLPELVSLNVSLAHEYAHHLFGEYLTPPRDLQFTIFSEGFAFGVERAVADILDFEEESSVYSSFSRWGSSRKFIKTKNIILSSNPFHPSHSLIDPKSLTDAKLLTPQQLLQETHTLGYTLFSLLERERGPDIYRQILHGEFRW